MFVVMYRWKLKDGTENAFQEAWATRTKEIKVEAGGLGSRLHKSDDHSWIAYAQWPSKEIWVEAVGKPGSPSMAAQIMKEATESFEILHTMEVVKDLLE